MIDAILYVPEFDQLVAHLNEHHPEMLERDDEGNLTMPPVVTGFARTPAVVNGNALMVYARLRANEVEQWDGMPGVEVLAQAPYTGRETADAVYGEVFADPDKAAKYDSVYDRSPRSYLDEETGEEITVSPPERFGVLA